MESNYTGKIFWSAEIGFGDNSIHFRRVTRVDLKEYIASAPESIKSIKDVDIINKYVVPFVYDMYKLRKHNIQYVIVKRAAIE